VDDVYVRRSLIFLRLYLSYYIYIYLDFIFIFINIYYILLIIYASWRVYYQCNSSKSNTFKLHLSFWDIKYLLEFQLNEIRLCQIDVMRNENKIFILVQKRKREWPKNVFPWFLFFIFQLYISQFVLIYIYIYIGFHKVFTFLWHKNHFYYNALWEAKTHGCLNLACAMSADSALLI